MEQAPTFLEWLAMLPDVLGITFHPFWFVFGMLVLLLMLLWGKKQRP